MSRSSAQLVMNNVSLVAGVAALALCVFTLSTMISKDKDGKFSLSFLNTRYFFHETPTNTHLDKFDSGGFKEWSLVAITTSLLVSVAVGVLSLAGDGQGVYYGGNSLLVRM